MELLGILALVLVSILTSIYIYIKYSFEYWRSRGVPHDEPIIPYGHIRDIGKTIHPMHFYKKMYDKYKPTGAKICGVYSFTQPIALVLDLEMVKNILIRDFQFFNDRGSYFNEKDDPLSANMFALDGEKWRKLRTKLTSTFTSGKMKFMFPTIIEVAERFRNCLIEITKEQDVLEMKDLCARYTTDIIGTVAFGIECNSLKDPNAEFRRWGRLFGTPKYSLLIAALRKNYKNLARKLHVKALREDAAEFFMKVVQDTVEYREKNNISRNDAMDLLIKLKNQETTDNEKYITMNELAAQALIFYFAGFETSSTALTFCLYELSLNPELQTKARQVIRAGYEKHNGEFTYEMMMDMPYLDQLINETLRKYPTLGIFSRVVQENYTIPDTNIVLEKGQTVYIPICGLHYDPEYFPNPEKFDPERFSNEEKEKRSAMAWFGFGDGPRNCIGARFGMMQARIGLVTLLNNFEFSICSKTNIPAEVDPRLLITQIKGGVYLKLKPIK